jgi:hypothetical protein
VVSKLEIIEYIMNENQKYIKTGIVEEINTALGYLTLYNESGEKNSVDENSGFPAYRTYTFYRSDLIETYKDGKKAELGDIEAGDSVFIKIDDNGELCFNKCSIKLYYKNMQNNPKNRQYSDCRI